MAHNPRVLQAEVIHSVMHVIEIRCIVHLIPKLLQNTDIIHFKLRNKAAHVGNYQYFLHLLHILSTLFSLHNLLYQNLRSRASTFLIYE